MGKGGDSGGKKKAAAAADSADGGSGGGKKKLGTCNYVKARHILCEKMGKLTDALAMLKENYVDQGKKVPESVFGELAMKLSECPSAKRGGDLGWFPRGKMEGKFQEVAFSLQEGELSEVFKGSNGYHLVLCTGRKA